MYRSDGKSTAALDVVAGGRCDADHCGYALLFCMRPAHFVYCVRKTRRAVGMTPAVEDIDADKTKEIRNRKSKIE